VQGRTWALPRQGNALHLSLRPIADIRSAKCDRAEPPRGPIERAGRGVTLSRQSSREFMRFYMTRPAFSKFESGCLGELVRPGVNDRMAIDIVDAGDDALLELVF